MGLIQMYKDKTGQYEKEIGDNDVVMFAMASGDVNPIHLDETYAKDTRFGTRIVHGMLVAGLISTAISRTFNGAIYVSQDLKFHAPVLLGDNVTAMIIVLDEEEREHDYKLTLRTTCITNKQTRCVSGLATILVPK